MRTYTFDLTTPLRDS